MSALFWTVTKTNTNVFNVKKSRLGTRDSSPSHHRRQKVDFRLNLLLFVLSVRLESDPMMLVCFWWRSEHILWSVLTETPTDSKNLKPFPAFASACYAFELSPTEIRRCTKTLEVSGTFLALLINFNSRTSSKNKVLAARNNPQTSLSRVFFGTVF